ncbi:MULTISPECIES: flagellar export protein FliJ [Xanthobacter]|uniref:flagellar export protein FliJ n=1 Tax=Xanthobacter TaxID=279 RepID=UPI001F42CADC|nr:MULTISPECIES: flagellar export protein FliJ [unclassified Xanthobacter]
MKSREPLIRAKKFQIDDARRRLAQIDAMIADFERMAVDLDRDIAAEEQRSGITDPAHFAYPPLAHAARGRRDNLRRSVEDLAAQRAAASTALSEAEADLALAEAADDLDRAAKPEMGGRRAVWRHADASRA